MTRALSATLLLLMTADAAADPCGMVPPISVNSNHTAAAIQRIGVQRTYVFHRDGIETIALRPGFEGSIDDFGMLIPFPSPPAIRKIDDQTFAHIEGALAPPSIDVHVQDQQRYYRSSSRADMSSAPMPEAAAEEDLGYREVRVLREEAVGMYQVAVLEAGSPAALSRWMGKNGYRYPDGMDDITGEYVADGWCFVAIKALVGQGPGVEPRPGMRRVNSQLPDGARFDGHVQGMGFRFYTDEPVVPMRLSVFNGADPQNVVYMLSERPMAIDGVSTDMVLTQLDGETLHSQLTDPLQVRYHNGSERDLSSAERDSLKQLQDPTPFVQAARDLFAADLLATRTNTLSLDHEEEEKDLLSVSESLGLRGPEIDALHTVALGEARSRAIDGALDDLREMHMTVTDGVFPGQLLADDNLTFTYYRAPTSQLTGRADPLAPADIQMWVYR
ncbi:MAG: hypothetical protein ACI8S6_002412 [Myxococcota bacterium]|jgi:hypothetical protein